MHHCFCLAPDRFPRCICVCVCFFQPSVVIKGWGVTWEEEKIIIIIIMLLIKKGNTLRHTKAITYFCKESFEEFPVLEVDVVKGRVGKRDGGDGGRNKVWKCYLGGLKIVWRPQGGIWFGFCLFVCFFRGRWSWVMSERVSQWVSPEWFHTDRCFDGWYRGCYCLYDDHC